MYLGNLKLDAEQIEAVKTIESFICIAGAGSGKTLTITAKMLYYQEIGIDMDSVLLLSYTRLSAKELETRLQKVGVKMRVHTFHSLSYSYANNKNLISDELLSYFNMQFFKKDYVVKKINKYLNSNSIQRKNLLIKDIISFSTAIKVNKYQRLNSFYKSDNLFYSLAKSHNKEYNDFLKTHNLIDYDDLIINACGKITKNYQYIIIDEFQDISASRFELIKSIMDRTNSKLYCFGDDYQSIYMFSGSRVDYFVDFHKYSAVNKRLFLRNTYRNSNELLKIMNKFILKNKYQIKKVLKSSKNLEYPLVILKLDYPEAFDYIFKDIANELDVLILARYNFLERILSKYFILKNGSYYYKTYKNKCQFLTCHKAKGLEATNVIVLEVNQSEFGIPSLIEQNKAISRLNPIKENKHAEERRLLYVAVTRTKNKTYLITNKKKKSIFIKELEKNKEVLIIK